MPLTEIVMDVDEFGGTSPSRMPASSQSSGYASAPMAVTQVPAGTPNCILANALLPNGCQLIAGTFPNEANAPGSNYPGAHWKRWDGTISAGAPVLGVDEGILENCIANYAPGCLTIGPSTNCTYCVYQGADGVYYCYTGSIDGNSVTGGTHGANNLTASHALASDYEQC